MKTLRVVLAASSLLVSMLPATVQAAEPRCAGRKATIVGTSGHDVLQGTAGRDVISGLFGRDEIRGGDGNDFICGGGGRDQIVGGEGNDVLRGNGHTDVIDAGPGNDKAYGGDGADDLRGGLGDDLLLARGGAGDEVEGGPGDDVLDGGGQTQDQLIYFNSNEPVQVDLSAGTAAGEGNDQVHGFDFIQGTQFADTLTGDDNHNLIFGNGGADVLRGLGGPDALFGVVFDNSTAPLQIFGGPGADGLGSGGGDDVIEGGDGFDTLSFSAAPTGVMVDLAAGTSTGHGTDHLSSIEGVEGTIHDDTVYGTEGPNFLNGDFGSDTFDGRGGDDVLFGGRGNSNSAATQDIRTSLTGGNGDDLMVIFRGLGDMFGNEGADTMLVGEIGARQLDGGPGTDRAVFGYDNGVYADLANGLARSAACSQNCDQDTLIAIEGLEGGGAEYLATMPDGSTRGIGGDAGPDVLIGDSGPNTLRGFDKNDQLFGAGGDDVLDGGEDTLEADDTDHDELDGGPGTDSCLRGEQNVNCE
jgi:Ca2+-binding RTX toxin-like protein